MMQGPQILQPAPNRRASLPANRRRRLTQRTLPLAVLAGAALISGIVVGANHQPKSRDAAERFAAAWTRGDYVGMYAQLSDESKQRIDVTAFARRYRRAATTATLLPRGLRFSDPKDVSDDEVTIPVTIRTRIFGTIRSTLRVPFVEQGDDARVQWADQLVFPGLGPSEQLGRRTELPPRASILARDGKALAEGDERSTDLGAIAAQVVGEMGAIPEESAEELRGQGIPEDARVGTSGLERVFQERLAGKPGGALIAGGQIIGRATARRGRSVRASIDPEIEQAAITALGSRFGSVAVIDPRDGEVLALAGVAFTGLGPPGSTFKVITTVGALDNKLVKLTDEFPVVSHATLSGVELDNANREFCGGNFEYSFAHSCNSVFAPLGAKLGAQRLVDTAEKFGFNEKPQIDGAATSTLPPGDQVGDDLAVGATAIGQGKVAASALQMASVAGTIAQQGQRFRPTLAYEPRQQPVRVTSPRVAALVRRLMVGVVRNGTGTAAAIPDVTVAGKTGTAELGGGAGAEASGPTDAWFIAFAPHKKARVAVAVFVAGAGAGGQVAAPIARQVLVAALAEN